MTSPTGSRCARAREDFRKVTSPVVPAVPHLLKTEKEPTMLDVNLSTAEAAMRQASMTADTYLADAITDIDKHLGEGYARQHPELIAAYMRTAAQDFHTTSSKAAAQDLRDALECGLGEVADAIGKVSEAAAELLTQKELNNA